MIDKTAFGKLPHRINERILVKNVRHHSKASEAYVDAELTFEDGATWDGCVPVNYRNTGVDAKDADGAKAILEAAYQAWDPIALKLWKKEAASKWAGRSAQTTKPFYDKLYSNLGNWTCQGHELPRNANWARRTQDIKGLGFTLATYLNRRCSTCGQNKTHIMLIPLPLGLGFQYESISGKLKRRILKLFGSRDAFEGKVVPGAGLLPDHKFPEVRWASETGTENLETMSDDEIQQKFQLLNNQRNQQKREVCRACFQTGKRGIAYGIPFFASGDENWPVDIPEIGEGAEAGCVGCAWYDFEAWRGAVNQKLSKREVPVRTATPAR